MEQTNQEKNSLLRKAIVRVYANCSANFISSVVRVYANACTQ